MKNLLNLLIVILTAIPISNLCAQNYFNVTNTNDSGPGSLRDAILSANNSSPTAVIIFEIPAESTIHLQTRLPNLEKANLTIDGTSAQGYSFPDQMITLNWNGTDDCIRTYADNISVRGLTFTNDAAGNGDAAIRPYEGNNLQVRYCRSYNQNRSFVASNGGTGVMITDCIIQDYANDGSAHVFRVNGGGIKLIANCTIMDIPRKVFELNNSSATVTTIRDNVLLNVGFDDNSSMGGKSAHAFDINSDNPTRMVIRNNFLDGCKSKFVQINRGSAMVERRDSIFYNTVLNCTGQHGIFIGGKSSSYPYIGYNYFDGDGGVYNMDQVIEFYYAQYGRVWGNVIKNSKARGFMARDCDGSLLRNNVMYNLSGNHAVELNDDCDNVVIRGNIFGTDSLDTPGLSIFTNAVIALNDCDNCVIGGNINSNQGNQIIASNGQRAIGIGSGCEGTTIIQGNDLNVSSDGLVCLTNSTNEVIEVNGSAVKIGGDRELFRNRIAGKGNRGLYIKTENSVVEGNLIGCTELGLPIDGNEMQNAIFAYEGNLTIGSKTIPALRNKIGYNNTAIYNSGENNVSWPGNEYWNNTGANVLSGGIQPPAITGGSLPATVYGTGVANARVEIYHWDPTTTAQGYEYLGHTTADGNGNWSFTASEPFTNQIAALQIDVLDGSGFSSWGGLPVFPPVANHDFLEDNAVGNMVSLNMLSNDLLFDGSPATPGLVTVDIDPGNSGTQTVLNVAGEGVWTYETSAGLLTFNPETGFTTDPAHIQYILKENSSGFSDIAVVVVTYDEAPPLAGEDESLNNLAGSNVVINILTNDQLSDGSNASPQFVSVDIDAMVIGIQNTLSVPGEGNWSYNTSTGELSFSPQMGNYTVSPIQYKLIETATDLFDFATVMITYEIFPPEANDDLSEDNYFGSTAVIGILENDILLNGSIATPEFVSVDLDQGISGIQSSLVAEGEGTWLYNSSSGKLIFTPEAGFYDDPTPIEYTLIENGTGLSDDASVTVNYIQGENINPPQNLIAGVFNTNSVLLSWEPPSLSSGAIISWDDGSNYEGIGLTDGGTFTVAARWIPEQIQSYKGYNLTTVRFFPRGYTPVSITLKVWSGENASSLLVSQPITDLAMNQWNSVLLNTPVSVNMNQELWVGYTITNQPVGIFPAGCDDGPVVKGFGDKISLNGTTWENLADYGFDYNWNIQAILEIADGFTLAGETPGLDKASYQNTSNELSKSNQPSMESGQIKDFPIITGYQVFRDAVFLTTLGAEENSYVDPDLPDETYNYQVSTVFNLGVSFPSEPAVAVIPGGMGPEIVIDPMMIDEVHPNPPEVTTMQVAVTNTGSAVLNLSLDITPAPSEFALSDQPVDLINVERTATPVNQQNKLWNSVKIDPAIAAPAVKEDVVIRYDDGENYGAIGIDDPTDTFEAATYFPASTMVNYAGMMLTQMQVFFWDTPFFLKIKVYGPGSSTEPGDLIYEQQVSSAIPDHAWTTFNLGEGVPVTGEDLWIGYEVGQFTATDFPAGFDAGPAVVGYGDMNKLNGVWASMTSYGFDFNWNIAGILVDQSGLVNWLSAMPVEESINPNQTKNIELTFNSEGLPLGVFEALLKFNSNDINSSVIEVPVTLNVGNVVLNPPTGLEAMVTGNDVSLTWLAPSDKYSKELIGYKVYRDAEFLEEVTLTEYLDENLISGTYTYFVTAFYDFGESDASNIVEATILPSASDPHISVIPAEVNETHYFPPETSALQIEVSNLGEIDLEYTIQIEINSITSPVRMMPALFQENGFQQQRIGEEVIRYDDGVNSSSLGLTGTGTIETSAYFPAGIMAQYDGWYLDKIGFFISSKPITCKVLIYGPGTASAPGNLIYEQFVDATQNSWNLVDFQYPILLDGDDLWIGYSALHNGGQSPCGTDDGPTVSGFGDLINIDGQGWTTLTAYGFDRNWNIAGYLTDMPIIEWLLIDISSGTLGQNEQQSINLFFNSSGLPAGIHEANLIISSNDPANPVTIIPVTLDVGGNGLIPPGNLSGTVTDNDVLLQWSAPSMPVGEYLSWDDGNNFDGIGLVNGGTFSVAARWEPQQLQPYENWSLTKVSIFPRSSANTSFTLKIWKGANAGTLLISQPLTNLLQNQWNEILVQAPLIINSSSELWVGYTITNHQAGDYPAGCDDGPAIVGFGDKISTDGSTWSDLSGFGLNYNWNIKVYLQTETTDNILLPCPIPEIAFPEDQTEHFLVAGNLQPAGLSFCFKEIELLGYNVYRDAVQINPALITELIYTDFDLPNGTYSYEVTALYDNGESLPAGPVVLNVSSLTGPVIHVEPLLLEETHTEPPQTTSKYLTIANQGDDTLEFELVVNRSSVRSLTLRSNQSGNRSWSVPKSGTNHQFLSTKKPAPVIADIFAVNEVVRYDNAENYQSLGLSGGGTFHVAAFFPAGIMSQFAGMELTGLEYFIFDEPFKLYTRVYGGGTPINPGDTLHSQLVLPQSNSWNFSKLSVPVEINGDDLWIGYQVNHADGLFPAGADIGPTFAGYGDLIFVDGEWSSMNQYGYDLNWNLAAHLQGNASSSEWLSADLLTGILFPGQSVEIEVIFNSTDLLLGLYQGSIWINSNDPVNPVVEIPVTLNVHDPISVSELQGKTSLVTIFPNPADNLVTIASGKTILSVSLLNSSGSEIFHKELNTKVCQLDVAQIPRGLYVVEIFTEAGTEIRKLILK